MNKTANIARGGLLTALTVILIYFTNITPTSKLTVMAVVSAIIPYSIMSTTVKNSLVVYGASSLLSLVLGLRGAAFSYVIFFGLYGFVKYFVEALNNMLYEIVIKLIYFNLCIFILYKVYITLFTSSLNIDLPTYAIIIGAQAAFLIFDYALTVVIAYIRKNLIKAK